jgi:hypothetical protein
MNKVILFFLQWSRLSFLHFYDSALKILTRTFNMGRSKNGGVLLIESLPLILQKKSICEENKFTAKCLL